MWKASFRAVGGDATADRFTDKIILPPSALEGLSQHLSSDLTQSPLTFRISSAVSGRQTHCGVREFVADEGTVRLPAVVTENLGITGDGEAVGIELVDLEKASDLTLRAEGAYGIDDWRSLLEDRLRANYTALTAGDVLEVPHFSGSDRGLRFRVERLAPADACSIVNTDVNLDVIETQSVVQPTVPTKIELGSPVEIRDLKQGQTARLDFANEQQQAAVDILVTNGDDAVSLFVGIDDIATSDSSFLWTNVGDGKAIEAKTAGPLYIIARAEKDNCSFTVEIRLHTEASAETDEMEVDDDHKRCGNCGRVVPARTFQMHEAFCLRNNMLCPQGCGQVFSRREGIPSTHWHCDKCDAWGNDDTRRELHTANVHEQAECDACGAQLGSKIAVGTHRATDCPAKMIVCRFCHLRVPQETAEPADRLAGLTGHEAYCGSRTADCEICKKAVRLRDLPAHMELHDAARRARTAPPLCSNRNCARVVSRDAPNDWGLCETCFGPLYSAMHDPTGSKLRSRLERRYVIQKTRGCGKSWCMNPHCATGNPGPKRPVAEILKAEIPQLMAAATNNHEFWFCVDETTTKRKLFVDFEASANVYDKSWLALAIAEARGSEADARRWLELNSVKLSEVH